ncbi:MAG: hypothetical protein CM1200mP34_2100 [Verrucomicrobiales bacterium]|nr:MAG: hypothetical protein CM1200mP34_2100 [Verrucomicrobiales bacterium]
MPGARAETLFESGAKWSYYKGNDHPSGGDLEWTEPDFDDSDWPSGDTPIRYGNGNGGRCCPTCATLTRRCFSAARSTWPRGGGSALDLLVNYDDGFVVWINGEEVLDVGGRPTCRTTRSRA